MLHIEHITASYHKGNPILEDVSLHVGSGMNVWLYWEGMVPGKQLL